MVLFKCEICKRGFLDQRRLDNHLRTRFHAKRVIAAKVPKLTLIKRKKDASQQMKKRGLSLNILIFLNFE